ncbi:flagellar biosynthesis protein FliR [Sulfobacillus acidophilus TPY]|uniref:Type III secretion system inner membrane R protein n=1 Tax=Sulfobacillus acidophilus (strain ATCC 700253 / DSM 10332 / NAL) TaxID=679936 RepID=G8U1H8_SULAD|nr:flagellar biosynthesis protein FliR [Sulfobacillus acidophilus TPY]AEW06583.1 type III secretion system inner membrane R protein [Sulfobacillus acidophilus DSM 10332]
MVASVALALQLSGATVVYLLVAARIAGIVVTAPFFGSSYIPVPIRAALVLLLAAVLAPGHSASPAFQQNLLLGLAIIIQFIVGTFMGLILAVFLSVFSMAGQVVTYQLGVGLAVQANPGLLSEGSFLSEWQTLLALFVFVAGGGPELMVIALHASLEALPLTVLVLPTSAFQFVVGLFQTVLAMALLIAAPFVLTGLVVNLSVGVISRAFPQINAFFFALPVNFGLSLLVFVLVLPLLFSVMPTVWQSAWTDVSRLLAIWEGR